MIALALVLALAQADGGDGLALVAGGGASGARWELSAARVQAGEPFDATLVVEHEAGAKVEIDAAALAADVAWLELEPARAIPPQEPTGLDPATSRWRVSLACLEPGSRELPALALAVVGPLGERRALQPASATVEVEGVLAPDEDAPRPALGFRPLEPERAGSILPWLLAAALVPALAAAAWLATRRRPPPAAPPTALERLERLGARDLESPAAVRELHYELTALVREELDRRQGQSRGALTDAEWLSSAGATLAPESARELSELLRASEAVKYGLHQPTHWAVRETLERARKLLAAGEPAKAAA
jgi:hypothetical protein